MVRYSDVHYTVIIWKPNTWNPNTFLFRFQMVMFLGRPFELFKWWSRINLSWWVFKCHWKLRRDQLEWISKSNVRLTL
jgi:hypothetical protein